MIELKGEIIMGRPKGGKNRKYTVEEKLSVIRMNTEKHLSAKDIRYNGNRSLKHRKMDKTVFSGRNRWTETKSGQRKQIRSSSYIKVPIQRRKA